MGIPGGANPLLLRRAAAAAGDATIEQSLRFNDGDSAKLSFTGSGGTFYSKKYTFACWVKPTEPKGADGDVYTLLGARTDGNHFAYLGFYDDGLRFRAYMSGTNVTYQTSAVYRDVSSWMHVAMVVDTANSTQGDRFRLYVNAKRVTSFSTETAFDQDDDTPLNSDDEQQIGYVPNPDTNAFKYLDAYLTDIYLLDNVALTETSGVLDDLVEIDSNNVCVPKTYSGSYGDHGCHLTFSDNSGTSASTLGKDSSGNSNNWTPSGFSVTAGKDNDVLKDSPSNESTDGDTGQGGQIASNYATLNRLNAGDILTIGKGSLYAATSSGTTARTTSTIGINTAWGGKYFFEYKVSNASSSGVGITQEYADPNKSPGYDSTSYSFISISSTPYKQNSGSETGYGSAPSANDVIGCSIDFGSGFDTGTGGSITMYLNGTSMGNMYSNIPAGIYFATIGDPTSTQNFGGNANFGQRAFEYPIGTDHKCFCASTLAEHDQAVADSRDGFQAIAYTGNGVSGRKISTEHRPGLVWIKGRTNMPDGYPYNGGCFDVLRGAGQQMQYYATNNNEAQQTDSAYGYLSSFESDGFDVTGGYIVNENSETYIAWSWDAGTSSSTNSDGDYNTTAIANTTTGTGLAIWSHDGTGGNYSIGHNLDKVPKFWLTRKYNSTSDTGFYHHKLGLDKTLKFNKGEALLSSTASNLWSQLPTDSLIYLGNWYDDNNLYFNWHWAEVDGFSRFSSYVGTGDTNGPFCYCGFQPAFVYIRGSNVCNGNTFDIARDPHNLTSKVLRSNLTNTEFSSPTGTYGISLDIFSNGFKLRSGSGTNDINQTDIVYYWAAWAAHPFSLARAR